MAERPIPDRSADPGKIEDEPAEDTDAPPDAEKVEELTGVPPDSKELSDM